MPLSKVLVSGNGGVASEHPLASLAGCDVLRKGGNAFDASVATSFALSVTMHQLGGLGGDFFGTFYDAKTGEVLCLNSSGWAPSGLTMDLVRSKGESAVPIYGPLSCVVPGQVAGVHSMHDRLGSLEFSDLLRPAASYAREGFPITEGVSRAIAGVYDSITQEARSVFAPDGGPPPPGAWLRQERLARVIDQIAEGGADAFYGGWPAEQIRETLIGMGVPADAGDFRDFKPEWVEPLSLDYRGTTVYEVPPNSMGATSLLMLRILSERDMSAAGPLSRERMAATMEAAETAYARKDRALGDPRFSEIDTEKFVNAPAKPERYAGRVAEGDTTAFSVVDRDGNIVSGIQSLFRHFGSRVFVPECGIMLNDRASGFSGEGPNRLEPKKRPLHTLSSLILERGESGRLAVGTSGGDFRPMQHALLVANLVDYRMPLEAAVDHPRFLWSEGRDLMVESGYEELGTSRYSVQRLAMPGRTGVCQAIESKGTLKKAVCDVRGEGIPAGY